jgi:hypothetical protein
VTVEKAAKRRRLPFDWPIAVHLPDRTPTGHGVERSGLFVST